VPLLPAGWVHASPTPSHSSTVQGLPSVEQDVLAGCFASAGQFTVEPSQFSAASHSPAAERQTTNAPSTLSPGHA